MASGKKKSSSKGRSATVERVPAEHFVVCVRNDGYPASLELRKLYPVIEDSFADEHDLIRVIDESGEDYLYPADYFVRIELPTAIEQTIASIRKSA